MTKSQHSATRPRISSLIKVLGAICAVKISLLGLLVAGVPLPGWLGGEDLTSRQASPVILPTTPGQSASAPAAVTAEASAAGGAAHVASPSMGWQASTRASLTRSVLPTRAR